MRYAPYAPNRAPHPKVVDTLESARKTREKFVDRNAEVQKKVAFQWPWKLQKIGRCLAVEYRSDKWHDRGDYEDYKHVAEAPQDFLACEDFLTPWAGARKPWPVYGDFVELIQPLPQHFAELAPLLGVQIQLNGRDGRLSGPTVETRVIRGMLGGAKHPVTKATFLIVYSPGKTDGMHAIITGPELGVFKDGIGG